MTHTAFAQAIGIHPTTLSRYLNGKVRPSTGEILANFLLSRRACGALTAIPTTPPGDAGGGEGLSAPQEARDA